MMKPNRASMFYEMGRRGAMSKLVDLDVERAVLVKFIAKCDAIMGNGNSRANGNDGVVARGKRGPYNKRKKLHWTQTPKGRAFMAKLGRERARRQGNPVMRRNS